MLVLFLVMFLHPCVMAQICCPPSQTYEGHVFSALLRETLNYAVDLDEQKIIFYSTDPKSAYFDYMDLQRNVAYEQPDSTTCFGVHPYPFGCVPDTAIEDNSTLEDNGQGHRFFFLELPFEEGYRNYTIDWIVDQNCITMKQSITFPFKDPFDYFYANFAENITDVTVFDRNLTKCEPIGTPLKLD